MRTERVGLREMFTCCGASCVAYPARRRSLGWGCAARGRFVILHYSQNRGATWQPQLPDWIAAANDKEWP